MNGNNAYLNIDRYIDRLITESTPDMPMNAHSVNRNISRQTNWN